MTFKRLSSFVLCSIFVFISVIGASADPIDSPLNDTWRIISGSGRVGNFPFSVVLGSSQDAVIQVTQTAWQEQQGFVRISINDSSTLWLDISIQGAGITSSFMSSMGDYTRVSAGEYNSPGSTNITFRVSGNYLYYEEFRTPANYMNVRLQRVSTIGAPPPPGGGGETPGNGGGAGGGGGPNVGGGEGSGGGGGCNAGFGLLALVALPFFFKKNRA